MAKSLTTLQARGLQGEFQTFYLIGSVVERRDYVFANVGRIALIFEQT